MQEIDRRRACMFGRGTWNICSPDLLIHRVLGKGSMILLPFSRSQPGLDQHPGIVLHVAGGTGWTCGQVEGIRPRKYLIRL